MGDHHPDRARRRNFNSLLILANFFRTISYFIVGIALVLCVVTLVVAIASHSFDTMLQFVVGSFGALLYGLLLFLGSELIRLFVGMGRDIARMAGRWDAAAPPAGPPEPPPPA